MAVEDRNALVEGLAAAYGERLRRFLGARVRNRADIPDIIQEVFLRLLRVPNHEMIRAPEAYIFTVAQHVARQQSLQRAAEGDRIDLSDMLDELRSATDCDPDLILSANECLAVIERNLRKLSPNVQSTFLLHKRDGLTIDEVSATLGVSRPMAKKYLVKALISFRKSLKEAE
jgi:RNA polymerase sigma-70 factor (ECF subfamily)